MPLERWRLNKTDWTSFPFTFDLERRKPMDCQGLPITLISRMYGQ